VVHFSSYSSLRDSDQSIDLKVSPPFSMTSFGPGTFHLGADWFNIGG